MKQTKIAITGATGFLGKYLVPDLATTENTVLYLFSSSLEKLNHTFPDHKMYHFIETDYSMGSLKENFQHFDAMVHLSAKRMVSSQQDDAEYLQNIEHMDNLLHLCDETATDVFIFASSQSVYDSSKNRRPFSESEIPFPINSYGKSKLECEKLSEKHKTKIVNLRLGQLIGWGEREQYLFTQSLNKLIRNEPIILWGEGGGGRDYLYAKDAVNMIKLAIEKKYEGAYNVGSGTFVSFKEFIETLISIFGNSDSKIIVDKSKKENREIREMSIEKAKSIYGWEPKYTLKEAFADMKLNSNLNTNR